MLAFVLRRLFQAVLVMLAVAFVSFLLFQYTGDPVNFMLGQNATPAERQALREALGLDQPFFLQFAHFVGNAVRKASSACRCARDARSRRCLPSVFLPPWN